MEPHVAPGPATNRSNGEQPSRRRRRLAVAALVAVVVAAGLAVLEARTSWFQSHLFSRLSRGVGWEMAEGPSSRIRFADPGGPYDERLGYSRIPAAVDSLEAEGFRIVEQARVTPRFAQLVDRGLHPPYEEKGRAGLTLLDRSGRPLWKARYPERAYPAFDSIPDLVWGSLLFLENRELLAGSGRRNPAVEWDRLLRSLLDLGLRGLGREGSVAGASTLATQIVKFRHSPGGRTNTPIEKLEQMASASLRAYSTGVDTREARKAIILEYLNAVPLSASPGFGEVVGIGDGLWAWFGADFAATNEALRALGDLEEGDAIPEEGALAFRRVLGLLLSQSLPTFYLTRPEGREALAQRVDRHLELMAQEGAIPKALRDAALAVPVEILERAPEPPVGTVSPSRKVATSLRTRLASMLGVERLYDLDRFDLTVETTVDEPAQEEVVRSLRSLASRDTVRMLGWDAPRLLGGGDPSEVVYTVLLSELDGGRGAVRVQADNFRGPFDLNESARLELGSTAKLRTLITYLEIVERLHRELAGFGPDSLRAIERSESDPITRWAAGQAARQPGMPLSALLEAAMERRYSANPTETFFTGGGSHRFRNFDRTFDDRVLTVREGFTNSVNLVFVRLMRDVERFYRRRVPGSTARVLEDVESPARREYLERFADREGRVFVGRFYREYRGLGRDALLEQLVGGRRPIPLRMARAFRFVDSTAGTTRLADFLESQLPGEGVNPGRVRELWTEADPSVHDLPDLGYLTRIHPLELWVARHLYLRPGATLEEVVAASADARQDVYRWLFRSQRREAQDRRIRILLEIEAFLEIQEQWRKLGYPFPNVVASYGSSIGSSGDRPSALAELVGILLSDGLRPPQQRFTRIRIAPDTPYETVLERGPAAPERVLSSEVAAVARRALVDVVERGTARTAAAAVPGPDGAPLTVGGKTGTGDNQVRIFGPGGRLVESRPLNRTATFVFFAGDELYGVVTAHVPGASSSRFGFTSALPVHVFRWLGPVIAEAGTAAPTPGPGG